MDITNILTPFLEADGKPVSGGKLAAELGVTRVSIWTRLEQLRQEGFVFEASPRIGYTLIKRPEQVHPVLLVSILKRLIATGKYKLKAPLPEIHHGEHLDSTNNEAVRRLSEGQAAPFVISAATQTMGRGRLGRIWDSRHKKNLYLSFAFRPQSLPDKIQAITLVLGLRLCAHLAEKYNIPAQIKWPNDIMCNGRKIAGILTEARIDSDQIRDIVLGIGLNVNAPSLDFPFEMRDIVTSLSQEKGEPIDINDAAADCILSILTSYEQFSERGRGSDFETLWKKYDSLAGKTVVIRPTNNKGGESTTGVVQGIDANGCLVVRDEAGTKHVFSAGEITLAK
ncbi:MAG: biotin--[acetyl-CoA-carboxylase] ligase [Puniceicoccales bacterium]|jgi:BirA family biotin operon repressor/biotin-[acetyl-CoA-carboxylase] ligase|nr:biotin--[acetyl-CoA-carboxylase] ligase [Puniceicoccales bacterium]